MFRVIWQTSFLKDALQNQNHTYFRYIRSVARRDIRPKLLEGKVKTVTEFDDTEQIESYKDFINSVKGSKLGNEFEIEKEILNDDYHGGAFERCNKFFEAHEGEESSLKAGIKRNIISKKYFKLEKETNLLSHAAKEQIRFLHNSNPLEWNCKALSECFPISENGVKKLLRSNYVHTSPEKIKIHDEEVAERWKILKSGKPTNLIFPLTQRLYKEGKLVDDYFGGNPNLPTAQPRKNVIEVKKKKVIGEFSAIVQAYTKNEKQKFLVNDKDNSDENQVVLRDSSTIKSHEINNIEKKFRQCKKFVSDELEDCNPEVYPYRKRRNIDNGEIPFSQFKEILKDETSRKLKKDEYDEFVLQAASVTDEHTPSKKPYNPQDCFLKISKYNKDMNIDATYEKDKNTVDVYKYDEKLGYQHPVGKNFKGKLHMSTTQCKKGKLYKIKQCIYDEDGEFLYKVPT